MRTLLLTKQDIASLLHMPELIANLKSAYITNSNDRKVRAQKTVYQIQNTSVVINAPGWLPESPYFTVKVNAKSQANVSRGLPFLIGTILMIDQETGQLISIMDSGLITAMRTGAAGAIGVECLSQNNSGHVGLIGAGLQGEWQIRALHTIGRVSHAYLYDISLQQSIKLADVLKNELGISVTIVNSVTEVVKYSDVVITTTQSKSPVITEDMLKPGLHINAFGADQPGKIELAHEVFEKSFVVVDDMQLACTDGALNVFCNQRTSNTDFIKIVEIDEIINNVDGNDIPKNCVTIFANSGLAFQDLVACTIVYSEALIQNIGNWIDL